MNDKKEICKKENVSPQNELGSMLYDGANLVTSMAAVSIAVAAVRTPIDSATYNMRRTGTLLPSGISRLAALKTLFEGGRQGLAASGVKSASTTVAKKTTEEPLKIEEPLAFEHIEEVSSSKKSTKSNYGWVAGMALGDFIINKIPDTAADLAKAKLPKFSMKNNAKTLLQIGFAPRITTTGLNYGAMCIAQPKLAEMMKGFFPNPLTQQIAGGFAAGVVVSILTAPLQYYTDTLTIRTRNVDGKLVPPSFREDILPAVEADVKARGGWVNSVKASTKQLAKQTPLKASKAGLTYATVTGALAVLGKEPLQPMLRFFKPAEKPLTCRDFTSQEEMILQPPNAP